jgi:hypothetical protein
MPLDNELSANVIDLCPVGALLDKDFPLPAARLVPQEHTPSIDPLTAAATTSGSSTTRVVSTAQAPHQHGCEQVVDHRRGSLRVEVQPIDYCKCEAQIALDLIAAKNASTPAVYNAANIRQAMAGEHGLAVFVSDVHLPVAESVPDASDMEFVEL